MNGPNEQDGADPRLSLAPFDSAEVAAIRAALRAGEPRLSCPRCRRALESSLPIAGGGSMATVWELRCDACRRSVLVQDSGDLP